MSDERDPSASDTLTAGEARRHRTLQLLSGSPGHRSLADAAAIAANPGVVAEIFGATDVGLKRENNQEHFVVAALERALLVEGSSLPAQAGTRLTDTPQGRLLIVADGIGGHGGGELASAVATDAMAAYAFEAMPWATGADAGSLEELSKGLRDAVANAQARVRRVARRKNAPENLGTTLTMAYVVWPELHLVHVGDSRAYLLRDGKLYRLTHDHTMAQRLVDGEAMTPEEAARSPFGHMLVNAVGGGTDSLDVELHRLVLEAGDHLMLCTDGLYDMVDEEQIAAHLQRTDRDVQTVVFGLIRAANKAGGRDNVTVVIARF
ncbi:MAG: serine/threonine-protein phosphatase [Myxococcales bacterium]|nr:serine/threonine-protein phosphatase [Myxococcales bacterium]